MTHRWLLVMCLAAAAGSASTASADPPKREVALLAGGCFWGMEKVMMLAPGVVSVDTGYAGGATTTTSYAQVSQGTTGHAETVRVVFDPSVITYEQLLHFYFRGHDPTTLDRQNNDVGTQYRSEIFTLSDAQRATAERVKAAANKSGRWSKPIVTKIEPATTWVRAEDYHQDYLVKHPDGYNDHWLRPFDF